MDIELLAHAKVNLILDVLGERDDGYHDIDTVMQEIELHDVISIENGRGGFVLTCNDPSLELDSSNLVYKAWEALKDRVKNPSVTIHIEKNIPMGAGLAGGSTDCATTLLALNELWSLNLKEDELEEIGATLGSDVPFFIRGGTQRARGRGEILEPLSSFKDEILLLVTPNEHISSRFIYEHIKDGGRLKVDEFVSHLETSSPKAYHYMENYMESVTCQHLPILEKIKEEMKEKGAITSLMSGSGPTVFAFFERMEEAIEAKEYFSSKFSFVELTKTV